MTKRPTQGGSYVRQSDGTLKRAEFTKPAAGRRRQHQRKAAADTAPTPNPSPQGGGGQNAKRVAKES